MKPRTEIDWSEKKAHSRGGRCIERGAGSANSSHVSADAGIEVRTTEFQRPIESGIGVEIGPGKNRKPGELGINIGPDWPDGLGEMLDVTTAPGDGEAAERLYFQAQ